MLWYISTLRRPSSLRKANAFARSEDVLSFIPSHMQWPRELIVIRAQKTKMGTSVYKKSTWSSYTWTSRKRSPNFQKGHPLKCFRGKYYYYPSNATSGHMASLRGTYRLIDRRWWFSPVSLVHLRILGLVMTSDQPPPSQRPSFSFLFVSFSSWLEHPYFLKTPHFFECI